MSSSLTTGPLSDQELVSLYLQTKNQQYFTKLYNRHYQGVYQTCISYAGNAEDAADFAQEIFARLMDRLITYQAKALFTTWLRSVTVNYCLDQLRKQKRDHALWVRYRLESTTTCLAWDEPNRQPAYEITFDQLPVTQRDLLYRKYGAGASINDLAVYHGLTPSAVKMRIKRAKELANTLYRQLQLDEE